MTPLEALQAATRNPARFLRRAQETGTIAKNAQADLVLLNANPLENISNTTGIFAVIRDGVFLDRAALDELLNRARAAAKAAR